MKERASTSEDNQLGMGLVFLVTLAAVILVTFRAERRSHFEDVRQNRILLVALSFIVLGVAIYIVSELVTKGDQL